MSCIEYEHKYVKHARPQSDGSTQPDHNVVGEATVYKFMPRH